MHENTKTSSKAAQVLGRIRSQKKAESSRRNGALGGRPKKEKGKDGRKIVGVAAHSNRAMPSLRKTESAKTSQGRKSRE